MPQLGEIKRGKDIGRNSLWQRWQKYQWTACEKCGKERWVSLNKGEPTHKLCRHCGHQNVHKSSNNGNWKGGVFIRKGWRYIYRPEHPNSIKAGYVLEHRLIMEEFLGRYLFQGEIVHHIDKNRNNNNLDNLTLFPSQREHILSHIMARKRGKDKCKV